MARDVPEELFLYRTGMKEKIILLEFSASVILSCLHEFFFFFFNFALVDLSNNISFSGLCGPLLLLFLVEEGLYYLC